VQAEILALPEELRADINQVLKVARKYEIVGKIASDFFNFSQSNALVEIGLIPAESQKKMTLTYVVLQLPVAARDSYAEIKEAIDAAIVEIQARKDRIAAVVARNLARGTN
jgi:hypothetical protein